MDEQTEIEGEVQEDSTEYTGERNKSSAGGLIDGANFAAQRVEKALANLRIENDRSEEIIAKQMLGGRTEAGQPRIEKKEETPKEYADRVMKNEIK